MRSSAQRASTIISPAAPVAKPVKGFQVIQLPAIGEPWPGQGGRFVGIGRLQGAKRDHVLILAKLEKIDAKATERLVEYAERDNYPVDHDDDQCELVDQEFP